jgi:hypothetical protein
MSMPDKCATCWHRWPHDGPYKISEICRKCLAAVAAGEGHYTDLRLCDIRYAHYDWAEVIPHD